jgi:hypothetical protein
VVARLQIQNKLNVGKDLGFLKFNKSSVKIFLVIYFSPSIVYSLMLSNRGVEFNISRVRIFKPTNFLKYVCSCSYKFYFFILTNTKKIYYG